MISIGIINHQITNITSSIVSVLELKLSKFLLADEISTVFIPLANYQNKKLNFSNILIYRIIIKIYSQ